ncbi:helix-turn-helix transcriptional regulator [Spirillospora albida]|uniref:helix-turn-helix transcriptional regulator n=1 Tax=Spirillospora albida TaxID=58123 RepID=UPI0004BFA71A|nr:AraC family transcriptional regulator [Spirillospora albida]
MRGGERVVWTRVDGVQGGPLDLLSARFDSRHYAPHVHDEYAIGVTVRGTETMRYRGERVYSGAGSVVVVEPGETHTGGPADPQGFEYLCFYPGADLLGSVDGREPYFRDAIIDDRPLGDALRLAHHALRQGADPLEGESRLLMTLGALVRRHGGTRPDAPRHGTHARRIAQAASERLADRMSDPPTLAELAADLDLSRYQLLRAFRDAVGMPPYAWLAQHRVSRARALLDAGHRPAETAALVGFADQAHLTRWFRRVLGVTPGAYRTSVHPTDPPVPTF